MRFRGRCAKAKRERGGIFADKAGAPGHLYVFGVVDDDVHVAAAQGGLAERALGHERVHETPPTPNKSSDLHFVSSYLGTFQVTDSDFGQFDRLARVQWLFRTTLDRHSPREQSHPI